LGQYDVTLFRLMKENNWQRSDFSIVERCYTGDEIIAALQAAGFKEVSIYDAALDLELTDHTGRSFFLTSKANDERRGD
jgi:hypothetical protein